MNKSLFFIACSIVLMLTSCATYQKEHPILGIGGNNINTYITAELDYDNAKPIEATIEQKTLFGINLVFNRNKTTVSSNRYKGLTKSQGQALYKAIENANVDIVVEPRFETETHKWFFGAYKTKKVKVKGWGLKIKRIKEDKHGNVNDNYPFSSNLFLPF